MDDGTTNERPFSVVLHRPDESEPAPTEATSDDGWSVEDLEAEYLKAVEAAEQAELLSEIAIDAAASEPAIDPAGDAAIELADEPVEAVEVDEPVAVDTAQVLEALLFVGGTALSPRRLADVVNTSIDDVQTRIDRLNLKYRSERRPYFVELEDGHYRLALESEYEPIRSRVHGQGPRDVRLAPDALEVLALVAYEQPLTKEELAASGKPEADSIIRQLIRRDLVTISRGEDGKTVQYRTSPRFLELFGLRSLNDLPRAGDLQFK
ncbi:MAG TPA: SMC-Scp complex subunit ScpB [Caulifigura sp.]|jgi:segregation and condensation protein B|nr:SMC-Scp complex subunit ScpB [Caulifigura sp.]